MTTKKTATRKNAPRSAPKDKASSHESAPQEPFSNPFGADMFKNFNQQSAFGGTKENPFQAQRQNMESLNEASRLAVEVIKSISTLQTQYMRQTFDDMGAMMRDLVSKPSSPDAVPQQAIRLQNAMARTFDHSSNVANILMNSNQEMSKKSQHSMEDAFEKMSDLMSKYKN